MNKIGIYEGLGYKLSGINVLVVLFISTLDLETNFPDLTYENVINPHKPNRHTVHTRV